MDAYHRCIPSLFLLLLLLFRQLCLLLFLPSLFLLFLLLLRHLHLLLFLPSLFLLFLLLLCHLGLLLFLPSLFLCLPLGELYHFACSHQHLQRERQFSPGRLAYRVYIQVKEPVNLTNITSNSINLWRTISIHKRR